ncbi:MAG: hypothetical protein PF569_08640 [Candidatus Woesearchaeota archaeon]|nr:hypothetical protein [Candidatus Woesearchaeota archaeon]
MDNDLIILQKGKELLNNLNYGSIQFNEKFYEFILAYKNDLISEDVFQYYKNNIFYRTLVTLDLPNKIVVDGEDIYITTFEIIDIDPKPIDSVVRLEISADLDFRVLDDSEVNITDSFIEVESNV